MSHHVRTRAMRGVAALSLLAMAFGLPACGSVQTPISEAPTVAEFTGVHAELRELPAPQQPITVAVYDYQDLTGQYEFSSTVQTLSRAVTQGAIAILIKALQDAGEGAWFQVVERDGLENLLRERQIIRETRALYADDNGPQPLPPLLFAGMLLEGGIISYDTNTSTGGIGARYLGIGASTEYRKDTVSVYLRAVSTQTGEILTSVTVSKTIYALSLQGDVFRFVSNDEIFEFEAGFATNEPEHLAIKQAIEKAIIALVLEGERGGYWAFANPARADAIRNAYFREKQKPVTLAAGEGQLELAQGEEAL